MPDDPALCRRPVPPLGEREVHVWQISLQTGPERLEQFRGLLSPDERQRADSYHFPIHRERFTATRGILRLLLGRYLGTPAEAIRFALGVHGKPRLADINSQDISLEFNVSHSHDLALVALCRKSPLGIDVERIDESLDVESIAAQFFSEEENLALQTLSAIQRRRGFLECWTRKEAYLKSRGQGLTGDLSEFTVSLLPGVRAQLLADRSDTSAAARWSLHALEAPDGYVANLAIEGHYWVLRQFELLDTARLITDNHGPGADA